MKLTICYLGGIVMDMSFEDRSEDILEQIDYDNWLADQAERLAPADDNDIPWWMEADLSTLTDADYSALDNEPLDIDRYRSDWN